MRASKFCLWFGTGLLSAILPVTAPAQGPVGPPSPAQSGTPEAIARWVERLSSPRPAQREQAMRVLELAGEPALEPLRKAATSGDLDGSRRAVVLVDRIEKALENQRHLEVQRYSFKYEDEMLRSVVANLTRKLGIPIALDEKLVGNPRRTVSFEVKDATPFEVIQKFMEVAGLKESDAPPLANPQAQQQLINGNVRGIVIRDGTMPTPGQPQNPYRLLLADGKPDAPGTTAGPLRIRQVVRDKESRAPGSSDMTVTLDVMSVAPKNWRGLLGIDVTSAVDEHGQKLTQSYLTDAAVEEVLTEELGLVAQPQAVFSPVSGDQVAEGGPNPRHLPVTFFAGPKSSKTIKELRGVIHGRMLAPPATLLSVEDLPRAHSEPRKCGSHASLQVTEVQLKPQKGNPFVRYRLTVTVPQVLNDAPVGAGGILDEMGIPGMALPQINLRDGSNAAVRSVPQILSNNNDGITFVQEMQLNLTTTSAARPGLKLVATGQREVDISVPFVLKNVQLP